MAAALMCRLVLSTGRMSQEREDLPVIARPFRAVIRFGAACVAAPKRQVGDRDRVPARGTMSESSFLDHLASPMRKRLRRASAAGISSRKAGGFDPS
jgi:hypothetical protein